MADDPETVDIPDPGSAEDSQPDDTGNEVEEKPIEPETDVENSEPAGSRPSSLRPTSSRPASSKGVNLKRIDIFYSGFKAELLFKVGCRGVVQLRG